jgi:hypothetical protein
MTTREREGGGGLWIINDIGLNGACKDQCFMQNRKLNVTFETILCNRREPTRNKEGTPPCDWIMGIAKQYTKQTMCVCIYIYIVKFMLYSSARAISYHKIFYF